VTYTDLLADICLSASTSVIRKRALIGQNCDVGLVKRISSVSKCSLASVGLVDLAFFHAAEDSSSEGCTTVYAVVIEESKVFCKVMFALLVHHLTKCHIFVFLYISRTSILQLTVVCT